ncbi:MAG: hypothetical protein IBX56_02340, partial [Methylomicrobium sp.]|nr:hypothetical protein [Methylomicrobium sp.]
MSQFNRTASAIITVPGERITIKDLRLQFYVRKTRSSAPNELTVRVFGVADTTAAIASRGRGNVAIRAGYIGADYLIAQGNVTRATVERLPPNKS